MLALNAYTHFLVLGGVYVPCNYRMPLPGGVIVRDSGLCCSGPAFKCVTSIVQAQLVNYFPLFVVDFSYKR